MAAANRYYRYRYQYLNSLLEYWSNPNRILSFTCSICVGVRNVLARMVAWYRYAAIPVLVPVPQRRLCTATEYLTTWHRLPECTASYCIATRHGRICYQYWYRYGCCGSARGGRHRGFVAARCRLRRDIHTCRSRRDRRAAISRVASFTVHCPAQRRATMAVWQAGNGPQGAAARCAAAVTY